MITITVTEKQLKTMSMALVIYSYNLNKAAIDLAKAGKRPLRRGDQLVISSYKNRAVDARKLAETIKHGAKKA